MVAKKKKGKRMKSKPTRQAKRKAAREKAKESEQAKPLIVKPEYTPQEAKIVVAGLMELPMKIALPVMNKTQRAISEAMTVKKGK